MPKYELTEQQAQMMISIIDSTNFKGADVAHVVKLKEALQLPIPEASAKKPA